MQPADKPQRRSATRLVTYARVGVAAVREWPPQVLIKFVWAALERVIWGAVLGKMQSTRGSPATTGMSSHGQSAVWPARADPLPGRENLAGPAWLPGCGAADRGTAYRHDLACPDTDGPDERGHDAWQAAPADEQARILGSPGRSEEHAAAACAAAVTDPGSDLPGAPGSAPLLFRHRLGCLAHPSFPAS
jgi:hypothetical protein